MSSKPNEKSAYSSEDQELIRAVEAALTNYGKYPNVLGVSSGIKFKSKKATNQIAIHFFVSKKLDRRDLKGRHLPAFVYGRFADGTINYRKRFPTDVIHVGRIKFVCAGSKLHATGQIGTITLFFRNKADSINSNYYLLTCSHVVGDFSKSPPQFRKLNSNCCEGIEPFAVVLKNTISHGDNWIDYDIALAVVTEEALTSCEELPGMDCFVVKKGIVLERFLPRQEIGPDLQVECQLGISHHKKGKVMSAKGGAGSQIIEFGNELFTVANLYLLDVSVTGGDSGGIVYKETAAVGIVIAGAEEGPWAWFQPLGDALTYLDGNIKCFSGPE